jgi:hypothetical protein
MSPSGSETIMTTKTETPRTPAIATAVTIREDYTGGEVTFTADFGQTVTINTLDLTPEVAMLAMLHGLKQKCGDGAALSRNRETGRSATSEDKFAEVRAIAERLKTGHWNKPREGGAGAGGEGGLLFKALCRVRADKTPAEVRAYLDGRSKEEQEALRYVPAVAQAILDIKAETAKDNGIDGEALLAGF